jgi:glycerol-3-phosphate dehydrogenase (NAD(P)+)
LTFFSFFDKIAVSKAKGARMSVVEHKQSIAVIGCGRWGSFLAWYLDRAGHRVTLYGRAASPHMQALLATRKNELLELPASLSLSTDLPAALSGADTVIVSVDSQGLRSLLGELVAAGIAKKTVVLCMKGIEISTGQRLSEVARGALPADCPVAVWLGPGHVQDFLSGIPNCMVIDSEDADTKARLVEAFSSDLIRLYYGEDMIGNEIGAAAKNVIGIAAGMLDGQGLSSLKGALMARGAREVARLIRAMGGEELSAYGLCHLGDYEATVFSPHSHNRRFGEAFVRGEKFDALAEGYYTARALHGLSARYSVEMPICRAVYDILFEGVAPRTALSALFSRTQKNEFYQ